jgi:ABC-type transport system involved in multi-copper enzyme maturation permease subunit
MQDTTSPSRLSAAFLAGSNPVLSRELRSSLRNERAFALLAMYVALLGAVVAAQFPADQAVASSVARGTGEGYKLFGYFMWAQAFFVVLLLPALASGALAQERERGTLEPMLLSPLTPGQIVWGKAVGVLCFGFLLLIATLPLTSMTFLLGGVSPADIITGYALLLGLAAFVTGFGLYCSARWTSSVQATMACYGFLPFALAAVSAGLGIGSVLVGLSLIGGTFYWLWNQRPRWKRSHLGRQLGKGYDTLFFLLLVLLFCAVMALLTGTYILGIHIFGLVFVTPYLLFVARLGLERTGQELARKREPRRPAPERIQDLREEWKRAVAPAPVVYLPAPHERHRGSAQAAYDPSPDASTWATLGPAVATPHPANPQVTQKPEVAPARTATPNSSNSKSAPPKPTYGVRPFLSDKLNPVFAKDLRAGVLGKWSYLGRFSYIVTIASQLWLLCVLFTELRLSALQPDGTAIPRNSLWLQNPQEVAQYFAGWANAHLVLLMLCSALFGARALAPEREQQTLPQLLTTPLTYASIVCGKMMAVGIYSIYVFMMAAPLALFMGLLGIIPFRSALSFLVVEIVLGALAGAWGLICSMRGITVRRALGWSLAGIAGLLGADIVWSALLDDAGIQSALPRFYEVVTVTGHLLLPFHVMANAVAPGTLTSGSGAPLMSSGGSALWTMFSLLVFAVATLLLAAKTVADFRRYASTV